MSTANEQDARRSRDTGGEASGATGFARWRSDVQAGLINAVVSVPDGLASAALAGVNPVYGLYTSITATIAGSVLVSQQRMQIATTSASALAAGQAIAGYPEEQRVDAMFTLVFLTGVLLALFGLLKMGRLLKYVSFAVMNGFLFGVAVVLILDQAAPLVGYSPEGANPVDTFADLLANVEQWHVPTIVVGVLALATMIGLGRTKLRDVSSLFGLVVPTVVAILVGWGSVEVVSDVATIPRGIPDLTLPDLSLVDPSLALAAFSLAVVIAVQGAGVSQSYENLDESPVSPSRDMLAQGAANVGAGLFSGIPAGGSVGQTALNVSVGAKSRWGGIFAGLWMLAIVLLVPGLVSRVPMAVLGALMIGAGVQAINFREAYSIWQTGGTARWAILVTLIATLVLSVPVAVAVGVGLASLMFLVSAASDVRVVAVERTESERFAEIKPPKELESETVTVLNVYGSLFFAGAKTLQDALPQVGHARRPVVVLRMRGRTSVGATLIDMLDDYADELVEAGGRLYLSGVHEDVVEQLRRAGKLELGEEVRVHEATDVIGQSTTEAVESARVWLGRGRAGSRPLMVS